MSFTFLRYGKAILVGLATGGLIWFFYEVLAGDYTARSETVSLTELTVMPKKFVGVMATGDTKLTVAQNKIKHVISIALQNEMSRSTDWRAFAYDALKRPAEGGYFYAKFVANQCGRGINAIKQIGEKNTQEVLRKTGTITPAMLKVSDRFNARCSGFLNGETSTIFSLVSKLQADNSDPLINASNELSRAVRSKDKKAVLGAAIAIINTGDSLLLSSDDRLRQILNGLKTPNTPEVYLVDGVEYSLNDERKSADITMAMTMSACNEGEPCAADEFIELKCLSSGVCGNDRLEYFESEYTSFGRSSQEFAAVKILANKIKTVIQSNNFQSLVK